MKLKKAEVYKPTNAVLEEAIKAGLILVINHRTAGGKIITIRSVVPLVLGRYKGGLYLRGYHLAGTSVSQAPNRSFRLFKIKNMDSVEQLGGTYNIPIPGYKPRDSFFTYIQEYYDPIKARKYLEKFYVEQ